MSDFAKEVLSANIEDELSRSYLDYAMSVIVGRALPDVKDGLKPVHRRVLYAMKAMGNDWNKSYKKSARVVGDVIGKYHPHGESAVYDAIVRMAQPFSLRYPLVDGQGNFGSVDGDSPAAMRYTEVRLARIAHELLEDLDKETVDFVPNYDGSESEPTVLPARIPNLLVNGSTGIAVGMATNIPPHNLGEVIDACLALIDNPGITLDGLMQHLRGPDFPTAGIINGAAGIREAYATGRGRIWVRARAHVETNEKTGRAAIVITELPYQVNKALFLERTAELVKDKKLEGLSEIRDESDKDGMRAVLELRRSEVPEVVLNNLYQQTQMESVFGINMVALIDGQPRLLGLHEMLDAFVRHRCEVVSRRSLFELRKARERAHVLEGLAVALANIDRVIELIRASQNSEEARGRLVAESWPPGFVAELLERAKAADPAYEAEPGRGLQGAGYRFTERQAQAILDMRLHRLTGLEREKITGEFGEITERIIELLGILGSHERLLEVIREELAAVREQYADARRTEILPDRLDLRSEDLIAQQDMVVTLSHLGYIKAQPVSEYRAQRRGGRGRSATRVKEEDFVDRMFVASSHATILCFSSLGKAYWMKVYELPLASYGSRGKPVVNLLPLAEDERINAILPVQDYGEHRYVVFVTERGTVKKTELSAFSRPRGNGIIAIDLLPGDRLVGAHTASGHDDVMLFTDDGKAIRFAEQAVRAMGRTARGVRGMNVGAGQRIISSGVIHNGGQILTATANGYGKRTPVTDFPGHGRGGKGVIAIQTSDRNGPVVGALEVAEGDEIVLISNAGTLIRMSCDSISSLGRNTQGVRLIGLGEGEQLVGMARVEPEDDDAAGAGEDGDIDGADATGPGPVDPDADAAGPAGDAGSADDPSED